MQSLHDIMSQTVSAQKAPTCWARRSLLAAGLYGTLSWATAVPLTPIRLLAASDLKFALADIVTQYQHDKGVRIGTSLGSSGHFARQIVQGLPADIFMSADEALVVQLVRAGHTQGAGVLYGTGRLALLLPPDTAAPSLASAPASVPAPASMDADSLRALLRKQFSGSQKFAIANPDHAPYGRAAREALQALGLWDMAQARLVLGENIAQATQFVTTGTAQAGMTALSLAVSPAVMGGAEVSGGAKPLRLLRHIVLPDSLHAPLRQQMVLLKNASPQAQAFFAHLQSPAALAALRRYGFSGQNG